MCVSWLCVVCPGCVGLKLKEKLRKTLSISILEDLWRNWSRVLGGVSFKDSLPLLYLLDGGRLLLNTGVFEFILL